MSKHHRCAACAHLPGLRITNNLSKSVKGESGVVHAKKRSCVCHCHGPVTPGSP